MRWFRARGCDACKAKDQSIMILADQVDYLRNRLEGSPTMSSASLAAVPDQPTAIPMVIKDSDDLRVSEEEEEIRFAQALGHISSSEAEAAIQALRG